MTHNEIVLRPKHGGSRSPIGSPWLLRSRPSLFNLLLSQLLSGRDTTSHVQRSSLGTQKNYGLSFADTSHLPPFLGLVDLSKCSWSKPPFSPTPTFNRFSTYRHLSQPCFLLFRSLLQKSTSFCWSFVICCNSQGCLPLIWLLGVLPPPEPFFIWLAEQVIISYLLYPILEKSYIRSITPNSFYLVISNHSYFPVVSLWLWWISGSLHSPTPSQPPSFPDPRPSPLLCPDLPKPHHCPGRLGWLHSIHQSPESALLLQVISFFSV